MVFGEVLEGYSIVDAIQNVPKGAGDKPTVKVVIAKSGELAADASEGTTSETSATEPAAVHSEL